MLVPEGNGVTGVTLYESLPTQQGTVYVRYYAKYDDRSDYHHTGMWLGGFNPPTQWPQGTAGITPSGSDFFHNALEPQGEGLEFDQYAQWPGMDCWMPTPSCYGNSLMRGARPTVVSDEWNCFELMLKLNTPGQSDGEFAVWINDQLIQHLREGAPNMDRMGGGWWGPDPNGDPFPGFNWRDTDYHWEARTTRTAVLIVVVVVFRSALPSVQIDDEYAVEANGAWEATHVHRTGQTCSTRASCKKARAQIRQERRVALSTRNIAHRMGKPSGENSRRIRHGSQSFCDDGVASVESQIGRPFERDHTGQGSGLRKLNDTCGSGIQTIDTGADRSVRARAKQRCLVAEDFRDSLELCWLVVGS